MKTLKNELRRQQIKALKEYNEALRKNEDHNDIIYKMGYYHAVSFSLFKLEQNFNL